MKIRKNNSIKTHNTHKKRKERKNGAQKQTEWTYSIGK
jgi:DNA-binding CsgD family transcriptional regulator